MKKHLKCTILFIYMCGTALAQDKSEYTYQPFIMDGTCECQSSHWIMGSDTPTINRRVISSEDSVFQGKSFKIIYDYPSCRTNEQDRVYAGLIREEGKRVYYVGSGCCNQWLSDTEITLYDFNLKIGDEITYNFWDYDTRFKLVSIDTIQVEGVWRRKLCFDKYGCYIEGIGSLDFKGITDPLMPVPISTTPIVICLLHGDQILYKRSPAEECPCVNLNDLSAIKEESRISFYVKDQMLCINAHEQIYTRLDVYSSDGKLIRSVKFHEKMNQIEQSLRDIPPGSYLFIVGSADSQQSGQFNLQ